MMGSDTTEWVKASMRNWRRFGLWVGLIVVCVATIIIVCSVQRHRALAETLLWMDHTYNPHDGGHNFGRGHGSVVNSTDTGEITIKMSLVRLGGCKIAIKEFWETNPTATYTLSLCDIDPVSIHITTFDAHNYVADVRTCADPELVTLYHLNCDSAALGFITTDGARVITREEMRINVEDLRSHAREMRSEKRTSKTNEAVLLVDDVAYAQRLAEELKRAVELCGGKPSKS
jgi:hypothetical protein